MPSVKDNTKVRCKGCGTVLDFAGEKFMFSNAGPCPNCGGRDFKQLRITISCDFCATTHNVSWKFPCGDFQLPIAIGLPPQDFTGPWAACDVCKGFIEREDQPGLAARALMLDPDKRNPLGLAGVTTAHSGFFDHRTGDPVPFEEDEHAS